MARLPATRTPKPPSESTIRLAELINKGLGPAEIAKKLAPDDPHRRQLIRNRVRQRLYHQPALQEEVAKLSKVDALVGLGPAVRGLVMRAAAGRSDAAKVVMEYSGVWSPKTTTEHTGEIDIRIHAMPRPKAVDSTVEEED